MTGSGGPICDRLPPVATTGLHKGLHTAGTERSGDAAQRQPRRRGAVGAQRRARGVARGAPQAFELAVDLAPAAYASVTIRARGICFGGSACGDRGCARARGFADRRGLLPGSGDREVRARAGGQYAAHPGREQISALAFHFAFAVLAIPSVALIVAVRGRGGWWANTAAFLGSCS
jgi:hypothetical protein